MFGGKTPSEIHFFVGFLQSWNFSSNAPPLKKFLRFLVEMGSHESRCLSWACTDNQRETVTDKHGEDETKDVMETKCSVGSEKKPADGGSLDPSPVSKPVLDFAQKECRKISSLRLCCSAGRWTFVTKSSPSLTLSVNMLYELLHLVKSISQFGCRQTSRHGGGATFAYSCTRIAYR